MLTLQMRPRVVGAWKEQRLERMFTCSTLDGVDTAKLTYFTNGFKSRFGNSNYSKSCTPRSNHTCRGLILRLILRSFGIVALEHAHSFDSKKIKGLDFPFWLCSIFFHRAFTLAVKALSPVVSALSLAVRALSPVVRALSLAVRALSLAVKALSLAVKALSLAVRALSLEVKALSLAVRALSLAVRALSLEVRARDRANYLNYI